jgi:protein-S-isoprenylcysteine O-methyltransferase Ste14
VNRVASIAGYVLMVGGLAGLLALHRLFSKSPVVILCQAAAVILMIAARISFGRRSFHLAANPTRGGLVTVGPYRYIRHPIYTSVCLFLVPGALAHFSWASMLLAGLVVLGAVIRIFCEEALIPLEYPEYKECSARTWRMMPYLF